MNDSGPAGGCWHIGRECYVDQGGNASGLRASTCVLLFALLVPEDRMVFIVFAAIDNRSAPVVVWLRPAPIN
jgi:hypothetical protein